jgi:fatty acid desaturase
MLDTGARVRAIVGAIRDEDRRLRGRHRWLARQDALGLGCFVVSVAAMAGIAWGYLAQAIPWWLAIVAMAPPISILHELEHDLIHDLYFKGRRTIQGAMFLVIAWAKLNASPWYRRRLHLHHHKRSGQRDDAEERLIGIGLPAGWYRLLLAVHPMFAGRVARDLWRESPEFRAHHDLRASLPQFVVFAAVLLLQPALGLLRIVAPALAALVPAELQATLDALMVLLVAPNVLRQTALALISSYCHYYEDIPEHDLFYQNQILDHWSLLPLQALCWNFGGTHIIHHFYPAQPFYLRQMVAPVVHAEMLRQGIRRNDAGVVRRANRWHAP